MSKPKYQYKRLLQFYETDAMGIIHHANYVRILEEARLQFLRRLHNNTEGNILGEVNYPLVSCHVDYKLALRFNEEVTVDYTAHQEGAKLVFDYVLWTKSIDKPSAFGKTVHVAFDMEKNRAIRLPAYVIKFLKAEAEKT